MIPTRLLSVGLAFQTVSRRKKREDAVGIFFEVILERVARAISGPLLDLEAVLAPICPRAVPPNLLAFLSELDSVHPLWALG